MLRAEGDAEMLAMLTSANLAPKGSLLVDPAPHAAQSCEELGIIIWMG